MRTTNADTMNAVRRLRELQLQLEVQESSMREYSGDPNYLGQKVNGAARAHAYAARRETTERFFRMVASLALAD